MKLLQALTGQTSTYEFTSKTSQMKTHSALESGSPDIGHALCRYLFQHLETLCNIASRVCVRIRSLVIMRLHQLFCRLSCFSFILSMHFSPSQSLKAVKTQPRFSSSSLWQMDNQAKLRRFLMGDSPPSTIAKNHVGTQILFFKDDGHVISGLVIYTASMPACTQCLAQSKPRTRLGSRGPEPGSLCPYRHHRHNRLELLGSAKTNPTLTCTPIQR